VAAKMYIICIAYTIKYEEQIIHTANYFLYKIMANIEKITTN